MPLAEGPSIDGEVLAVLLFVLLALAILWVTAVVLGFIWATKAGRGSQPATVRWGVTAVVVCAPAVLGGPNPLLLLGALLILGAQAACYAAARRGGP